MSKTTTGQGPTQRTSVLTGPQWEALLYQSPNQVKHLVTTLAQHHGHVQRTSRCTCFEAEAEQPRVPLVDEVGSC